MTNSGILSALKSSGIAAGRKCSQNFSPSTWVALPKPPENRLAKLPARDATSRRNTSLRLCASAITWRRISRPDMPAA